MTNPKQNKTILIVFGALALVFGFIVNRGIELPGAVLLFLSVMGGMVLLANVVTNPAVILYVFAAYLPFNKILVGDFGGFMTAFNLTNILLTMAILAWVSSALLKNRRFWTRTALDIPLVIFMLLGCFSLVRGMNYFGGGSGAELIFPLKRWLTPIFLFFIFFNMVRSKEEIKNVTCIIMFVVVVVALMAIKDYMDVGGSSLDKCRVGGIAEQPNILAAFFVYYMFLFAAFILVYGNKVRSWLLLLPFLACFRGIQVTFSRGGYLAFAAAAMFLLFFRNKILFLLSVFVLAFAALNPQFLPEGIRYRMSSTFRNDQVFAQSVEDVVDSSATRRIEAWKGGLAMIKENPLSGVGYGLFQPLLPSYTSAVGSMDAHNAYILIAAEMGLPALFMFLLILLIMFITTRRLYARTRDKFFEALALGFLGTLGGVLIANIFGGRLDSEEIGSYFWILAALVFRALWMEKETRIHTVVRK